MTPREGPGSAEPARRARGVSLVSLLKIVAVAFVVFLLAVLTRRVLDWKPSDWISDLSSWISSDTTEIKTLETLVGSTGVLEKEELLAAEYFGEVLVSGAEVKQKVLAEFEISYGEFKRCAASGGEPTESARDGLAYWFVSTSFPAVDFATALNELDAKAASAQTDFHALLSQQLDVLAKGFQPDLVYLARGNVRIWYELDIVLEDARCLDAEGEAVESCDLTRVSTVVTSLNRARRIQTTVNPYYVYGESTLGDAHTHGWNVLAGASQRPGNFEMLRALRILGHEDLRLAASASGMLDQADAAFARTLTRMIELFFDESVEVTIEGTPAIALCSL